MYCLETPYIRAISATGYWLDRNSKSLCSCGSLLYCSSLANCSSSRSSEANIELKISFESDKAALSISLL